MTDQTTTAPAAPIADANSVESIIDNAEKLPEADKETPEPEANKPEGEDNTPFPKKAVNAISRRDKQIGKLRAELNAEKAAKQALEQQYKPQQPQQKTNAGEPQEKDYSTYHEYIRAVNKYDAEQLITAREGKQKETQISEKEQTYVSELEGRADEQAVDFLKEYPDAQQMLDENADIIKEYPPEIKRALLEAENVPLALYNLAKTGKLESLATMSPVKAAMEIGRALAQAASKPKTKAPTPLSAARGSVPSGKSLDSMNGNELLDWVNS